MRTLRIIGALLGCVFVVCLPMLAHHGNAAYDMKEVVLKDVTITAYLWANPHCIIQFDAKGAEGKVEHWSAELGSPSAISLTGWAKDSVQKGDVVTIYIHRSKTPNPVGRITRMILPDGSTLPRAGSGYGNEDDSDGGGAAGRGGRGRGGSDY